MRAIHVVLPLLVLCMNSIPIAQADGAAVYLDEAELNRLRAINPDHYARAQEILASAAELCRVR
ncbi:MAG: hypothetical protein JOZ34_11565, partial [Gammaproteobacteria bacterium]|nr:hypothetical protein [Gammaproteobacteria bacterium]